MTRLRSLLVEQVEKVRLVCISSSCVHLFLLQGCFGSCRASHRLSRVASWSAEQNGGVLCRAGAADDSLWLCASGKARASRRARRVRDTTERVVAVSSASRKGRQQECSHSKGCDKNCSGQAVRDAGRRRQQLGARGSTKAESYASETEECWRHWCGPHARPGQEENVYHVEKVKQINFVVF